MSFLLSVTGFIFHLVFDHKDHNSFREDFDFVVCFFFFLNFLKLGKLTYFGN